MVAAFIAYGQLFVRPIAPGVDQHLPCIAISGLACILARLGGLVSPSLRQLQRGSP
jgi:hypothetical protein